MIPLIPILTHGFGWAKTIVASTFIGWFAAQWLTMIQVPSVEPHWFQHPAVIAATVTAVFLIIKEIINRKWQKEDKGQQQSQTFTDKLAELTNRERDQLLGGLKELHKQELLFERSRRQFKELEAFEARWRAHKAVGEWGRLQTHIMVLQGLLNAHQIEFPLFTPKTQEDLSEGLEQELTAYRKTLNEQSEEIHRSVGN